MSPTVRRSPGANGQGRTKVEARRSLVDAITLILEDRRKDGLRGVPPMPRHAEIADVLARKICRGLSVPEIGKRPGTYLTSYCIDCMLDSAVTLLRSARVTS